MLNTFTQNSAWHCFGISRKHWGLCLAAQHEFVQSLQIQFSQIINWSCALICYVLLWTVLDHPLARWLKKKSYKHQQRYKVYDRRKGEENPLSYYYQWHTELCLEHYWPLLSRDSRVGILQLNLLLLFQKQVMIHKPSSIGTPAAYILVRYWVQDNWSCYIFCSQREGRTIQCHYISWKSMTLIKWVQCHYGTGTNTKSHAVRE